MIIDFRVRPPMEPFLSDPIFTNVGAVAREYGLPSPASAEKKSIDLFLKEMEAADVVHCVCTGRALPDPRLTPGNEEIAKAMAQYPGKFSGYAGIDPYDVPAALARVEKAIKELGFKGIILEPNIHLGVALVVPGSKSESRMFPPLYPTDSRFYPIYEKCQELGVPVMLTLSCRIGPDIDYCSPVYVDRIAGDFPKLTLIISHACWPWVNEICGVAWKRNNLYLLPDAYSLVMPGHLQFLEAANSYLHDRILFGTVYPQLPQKEVLDILKGLPWKPGVLEKFLYQNAARLLGL